ncbi:autophagy-related protein 11 isoform X17 [Salmo salar]|uniref:Autophagy-related protein 11 isoform X17 n=1 Tax=Salmo salar TaxID=8030 RepID=A0ABM3E9N9_SALSA|nr:autophagy-related protein 11-like isoform X17 [Salmo salar]
MKTFPTSAVWCLGILFISVSLITTGSSEVQVVGPADPVDALAGDDIILPCSLKPKASAETMIVRWTRLNLTTENVHLYRDGRDSNEDQSPSYRGRTSMFNEELKNGNVSLKLTRVTLSDAGSYMCFIPTLTSQVKETTVQLLVGAVSQPVTSIIGTKGGGVVLKCESGGWFPEPEMEWLDSSGTILPADGPPERHRDPEGLYTVRRHVTVNQTDTNRFTCRVNQTEINHLKETEIHVPDDVFPKSHVGLIVGLLAAAVVVLTASAGGVYWWRKHMKVKDYKLEQEKRRDVLFVDRHKDHLIQRVSKGKSIASELHQKDLIPDEMNSQISAAGTSQDQMRLLFKALGRKKVKSDFYRILLDLEPDVVIEVGASFVDDHKDQLIQKVTQVKPIMYELFYEELYGNIKINQMNRQEQMRLLYEALEEAEDTRRVKSDFYRILLDLEPDVVKDLDIYDDYFGLFNLIDIYDDDISLFNLFEEEQRQRWEELRDAQFVTRHKDHLIQNVSKGKSIASELHQKDLIPDEMNSQISAARTSQDQMRLLFKALEEAENTTRVKSTFYRILLDLEPDVVKDLKKEQRQRWEEREKKRREELEEQSDAQFVNKHKDHLIQMVSKGESIASELHQKDLIPDEMNSQISAAGTSQDQMRLLFKALEEAEDTTRVKSTFYKILLDLEPDVVKDLNVNKMKAPKKLRKENEKLRKENEKLRKENEKLRKENDELKEKLRKAEETNQSLSTSPGGQQKTQTPSQKSEGIEGMEMESLPGRKSGPGPGRKSAPEMESLPGRKSAPEMESLPGRKSAPEMESLPGRKSAPEMKPLLAAGPQKEDLYDLERGGRDTTEFNYRETIPSGRKSGPEKEMEMKPLLGPGPQKDDLDELEREEELLQNLTMCYRVTIERL